MGRAWLCQLVSFLVFDITIMPLFYFNWSTFWLVHFETSPPPSGPTVAHSDFLLKKLAKCLVQAKRHIAWLDKVITTATVVIRPLGDPT